MKKMKYILVLLLLATFSCTNTEEKVLHEVTVSFYPALYHNTRTTGDELYPQDVPFGVWAYSLPANEQKNNDVSSVSVFMDNEVVCFKSGNWTPSVPYHWKSDKRLTFFAYSPASIRATSSYEKGMTITDYDMNDSINLLFVRPVENVDNLYNNGCISLPFISAFAKVNFKARSMMMLGRTVHLKRLYLDELAYKGTFLLKPNEHWVTTTDRMQYDFYNGDKEIGYNSMDVGTLTVMPQNLKQPVRMLVDIYDDKGKLIETDKTIESATMTHSWKPGKYYSYILNVYSDSITFTTDMIDGL